MGKNTFSQTNITATVCILSFFFFFKWQVDNKVSLNNIYLLTSHTYRDNHGGTDEKTAVRIKIDQKKKKRKRMMVIQYSCISWSIHNISSLLRRHSWSHQLSNIQAKQQKHEEQQIHSKTPDQRQVWFKEKQKVLDSGKWSSLTIYTAKNTEMVNVDGSQHRAGWDHRKHC